MPNTHETLTSLFSDIADAIRAKTGDSNDIIADDFPTAIVAIPSGGGGPSNVEYYSSTVSYDSELKSGSFIINTTRTNTPNFAIIRIRYSSNIYLVQSGASVVYHPVTDSSWDNAYVTVTESSNTNKIYTYSIDGTNSEYGGMDGTIYDAYFIY